MQWGLSTIRFCIGVLVLGGLACHEPGVQQVPAEAVFDRSALDFGLVPVGEWREANIGVRNPGYVPFDALKALAITDNPSFQVELDGPVRVMPGETRSVKVRFHPLKEGELAEQVAITTDANRQPAQPVAVSGQGGPTPIQFNPPALDFQTLEINSDRTLTVEVQNPVDVPISLKLGGTDAALFGADVVTVPPNGSVQVHTQYRPSALGSHTGQLEARACDGCSAAVLPLTGKSVASAFSFRPSPIPFDNIPVHQTTHSHTKATNITWRPVQISKLSTSDSSFIPLGPAGDTSVGPGESVELDMEFAARFAGPLTGTLAVDYTSDKPRQTTVGLDARGGRPTLAVAPVTLDFGDLPVGGKVAKTVRLTNAGTNGSIYVMGASGSGDAAQFGISNPQRGKTEFPWDPGSAWPNFVSNDGLPIAPGADFLDVQVYFEPVAAGQFSATIAFASDDPVTPERTIAVTGHAHTSPPCSYRLLPQPELNFGNVPAGHGAVLGFRFENAGTTECAVKDIHLSNDGGGVFWMPGGSLVGGVVIKDDAFSAEIAFKAPNEGSYQGELELTVSDPAQPVVHLPIKAVAVQTCLVAVPNFLDFGPIRYDCPTRPRTTYVSNQCNTPISTLAAWIDVGTSDQFHLLSSPTFPQTLSPGQGFELAVSFDRAVLGQHFSPLFVQAQSEPSPFLIPLLGEVNHEGIQIDRFVQGQDGQLDVLFVVSNTTTMAPYQERLKAEIPGWISRAQAAGVDLRVGVTTTGLVPANAACPGGAQGGEAGRLFPVDGSSPRVVMGNDPAAADKIESDLSVGQCHDLVQGLETMRSALSPPLIDHQDDPRTPQPNDGNLGLLRDTARLAVVFLADEDDHSGFDPESYTQFLQSLKGTNMAQRVAAYAIVPTDASCQTAGPPGPRFAAVAQNTGGAVLSVCSGDYSSILDPMSQRAAVAQRAFKLSATPTSPAEIQLTVDGVAPASDAWKYDAASNSIVFQGSAVPKPGQLVEAHYRSVCAVNP